MNFHSLHAASTLERVLDYARLNLNVETILIQVGLDPNNVTFHAVFNRLLELGIANFTAANVLALLGAIFLILTFVVRTMVPLRILCIISGVFFLGSAVLAKSVPHFFLYLLGLPINFVRLFQIRNLVKKARRSAKGDLSLDWLRPYMTPRHFQQGEVLFRKGDTASEMFLTVSGKFLVTEIGVQLPSGRILGELGFVSPNNRRTQSVECIENGEVLVITYEKLREVFFQNPEFGYYFLRLTSDRLLENVSRLEGLVQQNEAKLAAAAGAEAPGAKPSRVSDTRRVADFALGKVRAIGATVSRWPITDNVVELMPKLKARLAAVTRSRSSISAEAKAARDAASRRRRLRAIAVVERHANYSALGGFVPLPI